MNAVDEYGPSNPRDWDPNASILKSAAAPHETAAVLRMQRAGFKGKEIMEMLGLKGTQLMGQMKRARDEETRAYHNGRDVYYGSKT